MDTLYIKLVNKKDKKLYRQLLPDSENLNWQPDEIIAEQYQLPFIREVEQGNCDILIGMEDDDGLKKRHIELGNKKYP